MAYISSSPPSLFLFFLLLPTNSSSNYTNAQENSTHSFYRNIYYLCPVGTKKDYACMLKQLRRLKDLIKVRRICPKNLIR
jgi:hypothetical protein